MPRKKSTPTTRQIEAYQHDDKQRPNNPPVGLVTPDTDHDAPAKAHAYDPHLAPELRWDGRNAASRDQAEARLHSLRDNAQSIRQAADQLPPDSPVRAALSDQAAQLEADASALLAASAPYLNWAGKAEHTSFAVPTVSLHVHERIEPRVIIEAARKTSAPSPQPSLFASQEENPPIRQAIEFYKHKHGWTNRLIAGDSLLVMNSLLEKEGLAGQVQMVYIDPPYGVKYGSNFQPFVNKRDVKDGKDDDLTAEPEQVRAFRDTWELGIHSYLSYLRDRLLLARELLTESGSVFVQISDENVHHVRELMDEVFGAKNFVSLISFVKTSGFSPILLSNVADFLIWYSKDITKPKFNRQYLDKQLGAEGATQYSWAENKEDGSIRPINARDNDLNLFDLKKFRIFAHGDFSAQGSSGNTEPFEWNGQLFNVPRNCHWKTKPEGLNRLALCNRIMALGNSLRYKRYLEDFPLYPISNVWTDTSLSGFADKKQYVVQTNPSVIQRCLLMTTDPGNLVFDPTCGSGTTACVAEQWGRRWITCDTSRVALTLAKQRLLTANFDYYELARPGEGVGSDFRYKTVPHVTLKSIANNPEIKPGMSRADIDRAIAKYATQETLYDQPFVDKKRARVTGPFTVEAVPAPVVLPLHEIKPEDAPPADASIARSGATARQADWRDELYKTGIRGKGGQRMEFSRIEPLPGCRWLHADAETKGDDPQRVVVSFGPEHAPLEQRQVALAIDEALSLAPRPKIIVFAAFQFDSEAAKDIDETNWPGLTLLKAQMNADLLTDDLKKKRASNESFWLIGQPDAQLRRIAGGPHNGKYQVCVHGFDYYNTRTGKIESGGPKNIAMWLLDTDYDGRSLFPRQVFFPMAGDKEGWAKLAKNLKAEIDPELIEAYRGVESLPFEPGGFERVAVKIIDDRGIESLKIIEVG